ncbi:long-chain fatty acid--CoA ligase [Streptomyces marincola]|nr:long-chain fatty acid--CoA ligase [Streptomyces marincola]
MLGTMQDVPLLISRILRHGTTVHAGSRITTWAGAGNEPRRRTFGEAGARSAQLAHALREEFGIRDGDVVGTLMWNNAEHIEAYFGIPSMGAVLHTLNLRLPAEQLAWVIAHADDRVILVNRTVLPILAPLLPGLPRVEHVVVVDPDGTGDVPAPPPGTRAAFHDYESLIAGRPTTYDWPEFDERTAAALCYTSGTTGDPKGTAYSHRSVYLHSMHVTAAEAMALRLDDTTLPVVPMFHVNAWGIPHAVFLTGTGLLLPDRFLQAGPLADMIAAERPTHAAAVPTLWQGLLAELEERPRDISGLDRVAIGGSACPPALMRAFHERHGVRVLHCWGMTETSPVGTTPHPPPGLTAEEEWPYRESQGRFSAGVEARLAGPDGTILPWDGVSAGELEVRGPWIAAAYHGGPGAEPQRPADRFSPDGWLRTGDVGVISPDGYLTLTDRAKDVIKSGGEWISSVALENQLMAHPRVAEAAVVAVPDDTWGERPLAAVVLTEPAEGPAGDPAATYRELRAHLAVRLPRWQLPEHWTSVDAVPKTSVGKFDKKLIRARYAQGELTVTTLAD